VDLSKLTDAQLNLLEKSHTGGLKSLSDNELNELEALQTGQQEKLNPLNNAYAKVEDFAGNAINKVTNAPVIKPVLQGLSKAADYTSGIGKTALANALHIASPEDVKNTFKGNAPTAGDYLSKVGIPNTKSVSDYVPGMYSDTGKGIQLKKGGILDPNYYEAANTVANIALDPMNVAIPAAIKSIPKVSKPIGGWLKRRGIGTAEDLSRIPEDDMRLYMSDKENVLNPRNLEDQYGLDTELMKEDFVNKKNAYGYETTDLKNEFNLATSEKKLAQQAKNATEEAIAREGLVSDVNQSQLEKTLNDYRKKTGSKIDETLQSSGVDRFNIEDVKQQFVEQYKKLMDDYELTGNPDLLKQADKLLETSGKLFSKGISQSPEAVRSIEMQMKPYSKFDKAISAEANTVNQPTQIAAQQGSKKISEVYDAATKGMSTEAKAKYRQLLKRLEELGNSFTDRSATAKTISSLNEPGNEAKRLIINELEQEVPGLGITSKANEFSAGQAAREAQLQKILKDAKLEKDNLIRTRDIGLDKLGKEGQEGIAKQKALAKDVLEPYQQAHGTIGGGRTGTNVLIGGAGKNWSDYISAYLGYALGGAAGVPPLFAGAAGPAIKRMMFSPANMRKILDAYKASKPVVQKGYNLLPEASKLGENTKYLYPGLNAIDFGEKK